MHAAQVAVMDHDSLISICMRTYNNADYFKGCLNSLLRKAAPYQIPVYVSDNVSPDNIIEMLSSFKNAIRSCISSQTKRIWVLIRI